MPLVSFYTPWKLPFLYPPGGIEKYQWHEIGEVYSTQHCGQKSTVFIDNFEQVFVNRIRVQSF